MFPFSYNFYFLIAFQLLSFFKQKQSITLISKCSDRSSMPTQDENVHTRNLPEMVKGTTRTQFHCSEGLAIFHTYQYFFIYFNLCIYIIKK